MFRALEQPHESSQKLAILAEKLDFIATHACVNSSELEELIKVGGRIIILIIHIFSLLQHLKQVRYGSIFYELCFHAVFYTDR